MAKGKAKGRPALQLVHPVTKESKTLIEWAEELGLTRSCLQRRLWRYQNEEGPAWHLPSGRVPYGTLSPLYVGRFYKTKTKKGKSKSVVFVCAYKGIPGLSDDGSMSDRNFIRCASGRIESVTVSDGLKEFVLSGDVFFEKYKLSGLSRPNLIDTSEEELKRRAIAYNRGNLGAILSREKIKPS